MEKHKNGSFTSSIGFVLACVGSAVGLESSDCNHGKSELKERWKKKKITEVPFQEK